ncbi:hypothetical protein [Bosea sp. 124]|uniref:hypothetical protein n=1 Tax=Bosea sp. 124 TaxID=2135642 RepID=UPI0011B1D8D1|nr:hypothetical protein [Bosea sp. 124]
MSVLLQAGSAIADESRVREELLAFDPSSVMKIDIQLEGRKITAERQKGSKGFLITDRKGEKINRCRSSYSFNGSLESISTFTSIGPALKFMGRSSKEVLKIDINFSEQMGTGVWTFYDAGQKTVIGQSQDSGDIYELDIRPETLKALAAGCP